MAKKNAVQSAKAKQRTPQGTVPAAAHSKRRAATTSSAAKLLDSKVEIADGKVVLNPSAEGPTWNMLVRMERFRDWLYIEGMDHPQLVVVNEAIREFLEKFFLARYVLGAMQQSPRRNVSGRNGALQHLGQVVNRSSAYKFLHEDLGIENVDEFRTCSTMEDVLNVSPRLRRALARVETFYNEIIRSENPDVPPLLGESTPSLLEIETTSVA